MTESFGDVFADTVFWIALVVKQDQYHAAARDHVRRVPGTIVTTRAVLLEATNSLSRPQWRAAATALVARLESRSDVEIVPLSDDLWTRG